MKNKQLNFEREIEIKMCSFIRIKKIKITRYFLIIRLRIEIKKKLKKLKLKIRE
jgi:hypothetical protein